MNSYWNSLRPFERRVVVGFGTLFFVVLNFLFVIPHFSDLSAVRDRTGDMQRKLARYEHEIEQTNSYLKGLREFETENSDVPPEDQALQFANTVQIQANQSGVVLGSGSHINTQTNQFFIEKSLSVSAAQVGEQELVDFLYHLGSGNSQIRVRDLSLNTDVPCQKLVARVMLVASYQKRALAKPANRPTQTPVPHPSASHDGPPLNYAASDKNSIKRP